jgi:ATP-dependent Clp protease adaptor protein ClpS
VARFQDEAKPMAKTKAKPKPESATATAKERTWRVIVSNDPVNTMPYVVACFVRVLQVDADEARRLMLEIHRKGRTAVWSGGRERAEGLVLQLQQWHLRAELQADG